MYGNSDYETRLEYLQACAETYDLSLRKVIAYANLLGAEEDFDGLLSMLADEAGTVVMVV